MKPGLVLLLVSLWQGPVVRYALRYPQQAPETLHLFLKRSDRAPLPGAPRARKTGPWWRLHLARSHLADLQTLRGPGVLRQAVRTEPTLDVANAFAQAVLDTLDPAETLRIGFQFRGGALRLFVLPEPGTGGLAVDLYQKNLGLLASDTGSGPGGNPELVDTLPAGVYEVRIAGTYAGPVALLVAGETPVTWARETVDRRARGLGLGTPWHRIARPVRHVLVGHVDTGVDFDHPDLRDSLGRSRLRFAWDQTLSPVAGEHAPPGFGYGVEYDSTWFRDHPSEVRLTDTWGHGTFTLGLVGSTGEATNGALPPYRYIGLTPEAPLATVKTTFYEDDIVDGVAYLFQRADDLGLPAVVNLSLRGHYGPHDGTDPFSRSISDLAGPGHLVVAAVGNDRYAALHTQFPAPTTSTESQLLVYTGELAADYWIPGDFPYRFRLQAAVPDSTDDWAWCPDLRDLSAGPGAGPTPSDTGVMATCRTGNYRPWGSAFLETPGVAVPGPVRVAFVHWYDFEPGVDGGVIWVRRGTGDFRKVTPSGGYPGSLQYEAGYSGSSGGWRTDTIRMDSLSPGDTLWVRWVFYSNGTIQNSGWYLDRVAFLDTADTPFWQATFEADSEGFRHGHLNELAAGPGTTIQAWLGGAPDAGGGLALLSVPGDPYPENGDREGVVWIQEVDAFPDYATHPWRLSLEALAGTAPGQIHGWVFARSHRNNRFANKVSPWYTVGTPATGDSVIAVGATTTQLVWFTYPSGSYYDAGAFGDLGGLAPFSSLGPRRDHTMRPHLVAPGHFLISSRAEESPVSSVTTVVDFWHRAGAGTSASSPLVSGLVALLLEKTPALSPSAVLDSLHAWARRDSGLAAWPDSAVGWGKAFASGALDSLYFRPGDANGDGTVDPRDLVFLSGFLYHHGPTPNPRQAADLNGNGHLDADDLFLLARSLFGP